MFYKTAKQNTEDKSTPDATKHPTPLIYIQHPQKLGICIGKRETLRNHQRRSLAQPNRASRTNGNPNRQTRRVRPFPAQERHSHIRRNHPENKDRDRMENTPPRRNNTRYKINEIDLKYSALSLRKASPHSSRQPTKPYPA